MDSEAEDAERKISWFVWMISRTNCSWWLVGWLLYGWTTLPIGPIRMQWPVSDCFGPLFPDLDRLDKVFKDGGGKQIVTIIDCMATIKTTDFRRIDSTLVDLACQLLFWAKGFASLTYFTNPPKTLKNINSNEPIIQSLKRPLLYTWKAAHSAFLLFHYNWVFIYLFFFFFFLLLL